MGNPRHGNELPNVRNIRREKLNINISKFEKGKGIHKLLNKTSVKFGNRVSVSYLIPIENFTDSALNYATTVFHHKLYNSSHYSTNITRYIT